MSAIVPHADSVPLKVLFCPTYLNPTGATGNASVAQLDVALGGVMKYRPAGGAEPQVAHAPAEDALHPLV